MNESVMLWHIPPAPRAHSAHLFLLAQPSFPLPFPLFFCLKFNKVGNSGGPERGIRGVLAGLRVTCRGHVNAAAPRERRGALEGTETHREWEKAKRKKGSRQSGRATGDKGSCGRVHKTTVMVSGQCRKEDRRQRLCKVPGETPRATSLLNSLSFTMSWVVIKPQN